MRLTIRRMFVVATPLVLLTSVCLAFELPLSDQSLREAYFIGQHHDASTEAALKRYAQHLPVPQKGPYISEIRLLTPYAQVIDVSNSQSSGYSAQQAAADYRTRTDTILVRVRIEFSATYGLLEAENDAKTASVEKGIKIRREDFWKGFRVGLSQNDDWIEPLSLEGEATYSDNGMDGALIWLVCDAHDLSSEPASVEVFSPDGQHVISTFDLASLRYPILSATSPHLRPSPLLPISAPHPESASPPCSSLATMDLHPA